MLTQRENLARESCIPLRACTDPFLNSPVPPNHYHNQFAEIQEHTRTYGTWKRMIKIEGDTSHQHHSESHLVGNKRGRNEEAGETTGIVKTTKRGVGRLH
jgi:hypothetical protein